MCTLMTLSFRSSKTRKLLKLMRLRLPNGQELILHSLRDKILIALISIINSTMDRFRVSPTLKPVLMKYFRETLVRIHGSSTPTSHQALSSTLTEFQTFLRSSQVPVSPKVALLLRFSEPGSTISLNMVSCHTASLVTQLSELISTLLSDLSALLHQAQALTPNLTSRYLSMVLIGL